MTARRGSFAFRVIKAARAPFADSSASRTLRMRLGRWAVVGSRVLLSGVAAIFLFSVGSGFWRVGMENYRLHRQVEATEARNAALTADAARLTRESVLLHDPDYLVPLIHEELGLVKPHEVFIVVSPAPAPVSTPGD